MYVLELPLLDNRLPLASITSLTIRLSDLTGPISLQLPRIIRPAHPKHHSTTLKCLLLQRNRLGARLRPYKKTRFRTRDGLLSLQTGSMGGAS